MNNPVQELHNHAGEPSATLEHPPNIQEFDAVSMHTIVSKSPLLTSRLKAMEKEKGPQAPVINVVLPANYGLPPPAAMQLPPLLQKPTGLIPSTLSKGPRMDIDTFCVVYLLPDTILQHFCNNAITGTHVFSHITKIDLAGMGFKIGEVIDLKEAVEMWELSKESF
ncbi:hypothetical protein BYT27DRAFT_7263956 [Phlegmacium glaucopus]|nr:hypothetical protein BYT27DRAFT_7263956 [Phlegmacium glaucopus]